MLSLFSLRWAHKLKVFGFNAKIDFLTTKSANHFSLSAQCTVVERVEKSQNHFFYFFTFYDRFGYGKTYGHNIFNEFHQNHRFLVL